MPALILIYSGIDIFASLGRPEQKKAADRNDYIDWCNRYLPLATLGCDAIDLYAARCGVVHAYGMGSSLSEAGKAVEIIYSWGTANPEDLRRILAQLKVPEKRVLHIETLATAFSNGLAVFLKELESDAEKRKMVVRRAGKFFKNQPKGFWR